MKAELKIWLKIWLISSYDKVRGLVDDNNDLGKAVVDAWNDDEQNPEYMLDDEVQDILVYAGLIELNPKNPELESFDPRAEQSS